MMMLKRAERRPLPSRYVICVADEQTHLIQCHVLSADCPYCEKGQQTKSLRRPRLPTIGQTLLFSSSAVAMLMTIGHDSGRASVLLLVVVVSAATSSRNSLL